MPVRQELNNVPSGLRTSTRAGSEIDAVYRNHGLGLEASKLYLTLVVKLLFQSLAIWNGDVLTPGKEALHVQQKTEKEYLKSSTQAPERTQR